MSKIKKGVKRQDKLFLGYNHNSPLIFSNSDRDEIKKVQKEKKRSISGNLWMME